MTGICECEHPIDDHTDWPGRDVEVRFCNVEGCNCGLVALAGSLLKDEGYRIVKLDQVGFSTYGPHFAIVEEL